MCVKRKKRRETWHDVKKQSLQRTGISKETERYLTDESTEGMVKEQTVASLSLLPS